MQIIKNILLTVFLLSIISISAAEARPTVLELFTSEGCSACPAAEAEIAQLNARKDVFALSLHVDYWDYIGWKDPFASPANTQRQRAYRQAFNESKIYTPQVVVDGLEETVGSWGWRIKMLMHKARQEQVDIPIRVTQPDTEKLRITLPQRKLKKPVDVLMFVYLPNTQSNVKKGENKGKFLKHTNVVKRFFKVASWDGAEIILTVPEQLQKGENIAIILQEENLGQILGLGLLNK